MIQRREAPRKVRFVIQCTATLCGLGNAFDIHCIHVQVCM